MPKEPAPRKYLSADALYGQVYDHCLTLPHQTQPNAEISLADATMSGFAMFVLKEPSLLAFDQRRKQDETNLKMIFRMQRVPSDTRMREILDPLDPQDLRPAFTNVFAQLQRGKVLDNLRFLDDYYLLALDGTEYFSSESIHCEHCMQKQLRSGQTVYYHQMLAGVLVSPDRPEVVPLMPEPILRQDGQNKNDCERNALKRWLTAFRQEHPHLQAIATLDALYANAPVVEDLERALLPWIIRVKEDGNRYLFQQVQQRRVADDASVEDFAAVGIDGVHRRFCLIKDLPLNESNPHVRVDFMEVIEPLAGEGERRFTHILSPRLELNRPRSERLMWGGRARWKVENETFNTLKNQGYHLEHNYGHGHQNLSVVLMTLMMLAFLVDQSCQLSCPLFAAAYQQCGSKRKLWEGMRELFHCFELCSMQEIYWALSQGHEKPRLLRRRVLFDSS